MSWAEDELDERDRELDGIDEYDEAVERELIREANERNERYRQLAKLREEIEQYRVAYERAKKASGAQ